MYKLISGSDKYKIERLKFNKLTIKSIKKGGFLKGTFRASICGYLEAKAF